MKLTPVERGNIEAARVYVANAAPLGSRLPTDALLIRRLVGMVERRQHPWRDRWKRGRRAVTAARRVWRDEESL